ncbi:hypothetical protein D1AOALGA4SA_3151 [Olavius algarvensis Delta 1 endosymbiont]|nr:hypothetical protein D1AOALGA4SA_3151 [Olavius algarvensis Delta 1 endosymbiont]
MDEKIIGNLDWTEFGYNLNPTNESLRFIRLWRTRAKYRCQRIETSGLRAGKQFDNPSAMRRSLMEIIFHDKMLPSDFLQGWFSNDYLSSYSKEKKDFEKYYRGYLNNKFLRHTRKSYDHNLQPVIDIVRNHPERQMRLLEIGSGCGTESLFLALTGCDVVGIELTQKLYDVAQARKQIVERKLDAELKLEFRKSSFLDYDEKAEFDLIWMEQAFHHLEPRDLMVKKICALLKPGGYLIISEANAYRVDA